MKKKSWFVPLAALLLSLSQLSGGAIAQAQDRYAQPQERYAQPTRYSPSTDGVDAYADPSDYLTRPLWLFVGIDLGGSSYGCYGNCIATNSISLTEANRTGPNGGIRAFLAYYWQDYVIDGGFGWQMIYNKGTNSDNSVNTDNTRNGFADLAARYRITHHWQVGPEFQYWTGTDQGLNPLVPGTLTIQNQDNNALLAGLEGLYEWTAKNKFRLGARFLTSLNVSNRNIYVGQVFFQMGFNLFGNNRDYDDREPVRPVKHYERVNGDDLAAVDDSGRNNPLNMTPEPTPWPKGALAQPDVLSTPAPPTADATPTPGPRIEMKKSKVVMTLDMSALPFGYNNSDLPKVNADRMVKLGTFLADHNNQWKSVTVQGYTDERGKDAYNMKLSKRRAQTVRSLLIEGGASAAKVKAIGFGKKNPIDKRHNEAAWAKNRRVEMEFSGMKDMKLIKKAMNAQ